MSEDKEKKWRNILIDMKGELSLRDKHRPPAGGRCVLIFPCERKENVRRIRQISFVIGRKVGYIVGTDIQLEKLLKMALLGSYTESLGSSKKRINVHSYIIFE